MSKNIRSRSQIQIAIDAAILLLDTIEQEDRYGINKPIRKSVAQSVYDLGWHMDSIREAKILRHWQGK